MFVLPSLFMCPCIWNIFHRKTQDHGVDLVISWALVHKHQNLHRSWRLTTDANQAAGHGANRCVLLQETVLLTNRQESLYMHLITQHVYSAPFNLTTSKFHGYGHAVPCGFTMQAIWERGRTAFNHLRSYLTKLILTQSRVQPHTLYNTL